MLRSSRQWWPFVLMCLATLLVAAPVGLAHPFSQGKLDVVVNADKIVVHARVTAEEVAITNSLAGENPLPGPWAAAGASAFDQHAGYLASHLCFTADGAALVGRVLSVTPPDDTSATISATASYELEYPLPAPSPRLVTLRQVVLADGRFSAGQSWAAVYLVSASQAGHPPSQSLLSRNDQISLLCDWKSGPSAASSTSNSGLFKTYFIHGVDHILGEPGGLGLFRRSDIGIDHLLFVTALVLGTRSLWDLLKVVTAFTLAHTLTLTLAATRILHVPETVSEPLIALSIVFVAVQNVFWPSQSRGLLRYAAAFFFGLFHGLGFAGGLLQTMQEMHGATILMAIAAFSVGVEVGHQAVVLPLFALLKIARDTRASELARERVHFNVQRFGSAAVSLAGLFYLVAALRMSFSG